jgi:hypothetical protein
MRNLMVTFAALLYTISISSQNQIKSTSPLRVEFNRVLNQNEIEKFKNSQIILLEYIGLRTYIVDDQNGLLSQYSNLVKSSRVMLENDKFIRCSPSTYRNRYENFVVLVYKSRSLKEVLENLSNIKLLHVDSTGNAFFVRCNEADLYTIAANPSVQFIELDNTRANPDGLLDLGNKRSTSISLSANYGMQLNGAGINVAIQDDGNVNDHLDFKGRLLDNVSNNRGAHGDLCSGTMVAAGNRDPLGMGAAWGANLHVFSQSGYPLFDNSTITNLYNTKNIFITNTSYSDGCNRGYIAQSRLIDDQIRSRTSLMHVISAGNDGGNNCGYGAGNFWGTITGGHKTAKNCITVGSVTSLDVMSGFSSRGPAKDGRLKPEVCADGAEIYTTGNRDNYNLAKGTSQSAPGVVGLLAQLYQGYKNKTGSNAPSSLMKAALMNGCEDLHNIGPDYRTGYGRVNVWRSWKMIDNGNYFNNNVAQGDSNIHTINVPANAKSLKVLVYWHDKEAALAATKDLVNDLDMRLVHSSGTLLPWKLNPAPNANTIDDPAIRDYDRLNNHEQITTNNPPSGTYQIIVKGYDIPLGNQPYVVVYQVLMDEIQLVYPAGGEAMARDEEHTFRWDASHNTGSFKLEISDHTGTNWTTIDNNIAGDKRWYKYTIPNNATFSGQYKCRISRNGIGDTSNMFSIQNRPDNIRLDWVCADSAQVRWDAAIGANQYKVYQLGVKYMDSIAVTSNTYFVAKGLNPLVEDWFSSQAMGANNALSRRGYAVEKNPGLLNCPSQVDLKLASIVSPEGSIMNCVKNDSLKIVLRIINNGMDVSDIPVHFHHNKLPFQTDTIRTTLIRNTENIVTLTKTVSAKTTGIDSMMIYLAHPADAYRANDTLLFLWNNISATSQAIPFVEEFDSYADADTAFDCYTDHIMPAPWHNDLNTAQDDMDWRIRSGATPSPESGPNGDTTTANANGKYAYAQSGNCEDFVAKLNLGCINLDTAHNPYMTYFYSMNGNNMGEHRVEIFGNGKWNFDTINRKLGHQGAAWKQHRIDLTPYNGQKIMLRWIAKVKGELGSDMAIDRIRIQDSIIYDTILLSRTPTAGGVVAGNGVYTRGTNLTVTATTNAGYTFTNWTENGNPVSTNTSYTFTSSGNRNLVANFTQNIIKDTVKVSSNPIAGGTTTGAGVYNRNSNVTLTAAANAGYTFTNWTENGNIVSTNNNFAFVLSGNRNLVANFTQNPTNHTITISKNPSIGGTVVGDGTFGSGTNASVHATPNTGFTFTNWTENGNIVSTNTTYQFVLSSNRNLVANFIQSPGNFVVITSSNPPAGGTTAGSGSYPSGTNVTVIANTNAGYSFSNWTENGSIVHLNQSFQFAITVNRNLVANFVQNTNGIASSNFINFSIYPNPTCSIVHIAAESEIESIIIRDLLGKEIRKIDANEHKKELTIDVNDISAGVYIMETKTNAGHKLTKFVIEK